MVRIILLTLLLTNALLSKENDTYKKSINFTTLSQKEGIIPSDYMGYSELSRWASYQMLYLKPDSPIYGIKDGICRMVPTEGISFYLTIPPETKEKVYLYLDLTTYEKVGNVTLPTRSLNIYVSKQLKKVVYFRTDKTEENPIMIPLDPIDFSSGKIEVNLSPDSTTSGRFWGIWDAFYSFQKEK